MSGSPNKEHVWLQVSLQSSALKAHRHCASAPFCNVHLILFVDQDGTHAESCIKMLTYANNKLSNAAAVLSGCLWSADCLQGITGSVDKRCHAPRHKSLFLLQWSCLYQIHSGNDGPASSDGKDCMQSSISKQHYIAPSSSCMICVWLRGQCWCTKVLWWHVDQKMRSVTGVVITVAACWQGTGSGQSAQVVCTSYMQCKLIDWLDKQAGQTFTMAAAVVMPSKTTFHFHKHFDVPYLVHEASWWSECIWQVTNGRQCSQTTALQPRS